jgi:Ca-activated chloride channel homolog
MTTVMVRGAVAGCALMFAQLLANAQQPTFRAETELVNLNVTVVGPDARPVAGLEEDQFEVFENGVRQELKFFAPGELPLDVAIMLDTSGSMAGSMALIQSAAVRLVNALRADDRVSVMTISGGLRIALPFSFDKGAASDAVRSSKVGGRTPLYASVYTALRELEKERRTSGAARRQAIVVLSDGQDTASGFGFDELLDAVRRHAVPIYTIAPRPTAVLRAQRELAFGETSLQQDFELRRLAIETGGRAFFPVRLQELAGVYDTIALELAHQYSLGYQSTNSTGAGAFRRIGLRVAAPGVQWRTRSGYIADDAVSGDDDLR